MSGDDLFRGRWALVTGASSGLGAEFARQLAARGANVLLSARSEGALDALGDELSARHGILSRTLAEDLARPGGADALVDRVRSLDLTVDHVVNNAGFGAGGAFTAVDVGRAAEMIRLNCEALTVLTAGLLPPMVARGAGGFLQVASVAGFQPTPYLTVYGATKAYVVSFTAGLAEELRGTGVRMCALCPGPVATGFQARAGIEIAPQQRAAVLSCEETVRRGLDAYARGDRECVPGVVNVLGGVAAKLLPRALVTRAAGDMMKSRGRS
jgi:short-subunit dehydrogenase